MTLYTPPMSRTMWYYDNFGATPNTSPGALITTSTTANTEGSWTQVASSTNMSDDADGVYLMVHSYNLSANTRVGLLDIGVDPAGGTSYTELVSDILVGGLGPATGLTSTEFFFPIKISSGSSVAIRLLGRWGAVTLRACIKFYGAKTKNAVFPIGAYSETLGAGIGKGTEFTPGNAANGTWTSLGTTTRPLWWWQLGYSIYNTVITAEATWIELGTGDGTAAGTIPFFRQLHLGTSNETNAFLDNQNLLYHQAYFPVPAGQTIYVRGRCTNAPDTNYNAVAIGVGG